ncbi:unnamed protein product (macronuclear) [Paramecium tetraurelia]|uniref:Alkyl transferase n=1 Tax=Paramecium tetraurelia TaxID=5888 RepID=A0D6J4_PARTE|nr:uncharacterized protein GSPATT00001702001 [Paramecium tetraurelia]CAK78661.1 unnamed protein product [Paramecium tetraurelia]|eukprot:XP_001446058.1 hypothetical protein (macronuclear) [Paramecium tetraurelia strain d4-2]
MNIVQSSFIHLLKLGNIPNHVGVIMDGNRRYAKQRRIEPTEGHIQGYQSFLNLLEWSQKLGIKEISVFAFSIENYNRQRDEVQFLMELMKQKMHHLQHDLNFIDQNQVRVKCCGDLDILQDQELKSKLLELETYSSKYSQYKLNICFSYNFTNELEKAIQSMPKGLTKQEFFQQLSSHLMVTNSPDILLRTSGETRLSNFLLYQIRENTVIHFIDKKWPELSFLDFCNMILFYRKNKI